MHRSKTLLTVTILAHCLAAASFADEWERQQFANGKYMITFPTPPKKIMGKTPDGTDFPGLLCTRNGGALGVSWMPIEKFPQQSDNPKSLGMHMLNGLKSNAEFKNHKLLFLTPTSYAGWPAADLGASVTKRNGKTLYFRQRFIATETHLIQAMYIDTTRMPLEPWVGDIFFNSLMTVEDVQKAAAVAR